MGTRKISPPFVVPEKYPIFIDGCGYGERYNGEIYRSEDEYLEKIGRDKRLRQLRDIFCGNPSLIRVDLETLDKVISMLGLTG